MTSGMPFSVALILQKTLFIVGSQALRKTINNKCWRQFIHDSNLVQLLLVNGFKCQISNRYNVFFISKVHASAIQANLVHVGVFNWNLIEYSLRSKKYESVGENSRPPFTYWNEVKLMKIKGIKHQARAIQNIELWNIEMPNEISQFIFVVCVTFKFLHTMHLIQIFMQNLAQICHFCYCKWRGES